VNTSVTASNATATYGDAAVTLSAIISPSTVNAGTVTFTLKSGTTIVGTVTSGTVSAGAASASFALAGVNADTYTIDAAYSGAAGFNTSNNSSQTPAPMLTVNPAPVTVTAGSGSGVYNGLMQAPGACTVTGVFTGDLTCANDPASVGPDVDTYVITPVPSSANLGNFTITPVDGSYTIDPAPVTVTAGSGSGVYNGLVQAPGACAVTGVFTGDLTCANDPASVGPDVDTYVITPVPSSANLGNFTITPVNGSYTIDPAPVTVTADHKTKTFGEPNPVLTATVLGQVAGGDPVNYTLSTTATQSSTVGNYPVTVTLGSNPNYTVTATDGTLTVLTACSAFNGFLPPIGGSVENGMGGSYANPLRAFKLNSTVPVRFSATCNGQPLTTGVHTLKAIKYSNATTSETAIDATPTDATTTGNQFRLTGSEWHFNLGTKVLGNNGQGIWLLEATLYDGSTYSVWVEIKR
jgi:hypothetical protein